MAPSKSPLCPSTGRIWHERPECPCGYEFVYRPPKASKPHVPKEPEPDYGWIDWTTGYRWQIREGKPWIWLGTVPKRGWLAVLWMTGLLNKIPAERKGRP